MATKTIEPIRHTIRVNDKEDSLILKACAPGETIGGYIKKVILVTVSNEAVKKAVRSAINKHFKK